MVTKQSAGDLLDVFVGGLDLFAAALACLLHAFHCALDGRVGLAADRLDEGAALLADVAGPVLVLLREPGAGLVAVQARLQLKLVREALARVQHLQTLRDELRGGGGVRGSEGFRGGSDGSDRDAVQSPAGPGPAVMWTGQTG